MVLHYSAAYYQETGKGFNYFMEGYLHPPNKKITPPKNIFYTFLFKTKIEIGHGLTFLLPN